MYQLDLDGVQRYIDELDEPARAAIDDAVRSTIHYMLGMRNGACYRFAAAIEFGVEEVRRSHLRSRGEQ